MIRDEAPLYEPWLKYMVGGILASTFILGFIFLPFDLTGAYCLLGLTVFDALMFYAIIPRRLQIFGDRLRIALGRPFAFDMPFSTIKEAREASGTKAYFYWGIRFATSSRNVVEIVRRRKLNVVISPANVKTFLECLNQALKDVSPAR